MAPSFRSLAATTTGLTFALILLGVYTGATGAGLACAGRWPLCDGFLGLFPATVPSFIEWFHRFVAMVAGFAILGTAIVAWRNRFSRRVRYMTLLALVVTPVQVLLGANTIFNFGVWARVLHHGTALLIFASMVATTTLAFTGGARVSTDTDADAGVDSDAPATSADD